MDSYGTGIYRAKILSKTMYAGSISLCIALPNEEYAGRCFSPDHKLFSIDRTDIKLSLVPLDLSTLRSVSDD